MYCLDDLGMRKVEAFVVTLQLLSASFQNLTTIVIFGEIVFLNHGTHGTVQYHYSVAWQFHSTTVSNKQSY